MKTITSLLAFVVLITVKSSAIPVYIPPNNIIQNGNFQSYFTDWSGNVPAILGNWSSVPNNNAALANDIYQTLPTTPGQEYELSFYAAADLYFGPDVDILLALNNQPITLFDTPPYTYNSGINRYDQMHWEDFTVFFTASSSATKLELIDENTYDFGLAAVSVIPVPDSGSTAWMLIIALAGLCRCYQRLKAQPNQSPEPTAVAAAVAIHVASRRWLSFFR
jgi:hypothetical protein